MKNRVLIISSIVILIIIICISWISFIVHEDGEKVLNFIKNNPEKSAIYLIRNDTVIAEQNSDTVMPLASTVKTVVAIEFARQVSNGIINPNEKIDTLELEKYYLGGTDGGAHYEWKKMLHKKNLLDSGKVSLLEIAKGMIRFSSNANTEFLMDKLGFDNLNSLLDSLNLKTHQKFYPFVSALFVCQKPKDEDDKQFIEKLGMMDMNEYLKKSFEVHAKLKHDTLFIKTFDGKRLYMEYQKIWSQRLIGGSPKEYASITKKINSRKYFDSSTQNILDEIMEWPMINSENKNSFNHFGSKGGSTAFVLTESLYTTDKSGNKTELALFFNNLSSLQNIRLQASLDDFILKTLKDESFRDKITETLKN